MLQVLELSAKFAAAVQSSEVAMLVHCRELTLFQDPEGAHVARAALINAEQALTYLEVTDCCMWALTRAQTLQANLLHTSRLLRDIKQQFTQELDQLLTTVQSKTAVATDKVYVRFSSLRSMTDTSFVQPLFISIAEVWGIFQRETAFIRMLQSLFKECQRFSQVCGWRCCGSGSLSNRKSMTSQRTSSLLSPT